MRPFYDTSASILKSLMLIDIHCHYMDECAWDILYKTSFCGSKKERGADGISTTQG